MKPYLAYNKPATIVIALVAVIIISGLSTNILPAWLQKTFEFVTEALNLSLHCSRTEWHDYWQNSWPIYFPVYRIYYYFCNSTTLTVFLFTELLTVHRSWQVFSQSWHQLLDTAAIWQFSGPSEESTWQKGHQTSRPTVTFGIITCFFEEGNSQSHSF